MSIDRRIIPIHERRQLEDSFGRPMQDLRISVMDRCNFRCSYCMPRETFNDKYRFLPSAERLTFEEITRVARLFVGLGVRKLRLTGGEPLLRANLPDVVGELSAIDGVDDVALTTNGVLLKQHAAELKANGLRRVTVSLDTLDPVVFRQMNGGFDGLAQVLEGIGAARAAGLWPIKVNAVVQRGINDHTVMDLVERFRGTGIIVRLIEYMDVGTRNDWRADRVVPSRELLERIAGRWRVRPLQRGYHGEVAERYEFEDGGGEVGFISSVTQPFCGDCTRARLSSDGRLYTCLFSGQGTDLRTPLRASATDEELRDVVVGTWRRRVDRYSERRQEVRGAATDRKVEMFHIGG